MWRGLLPGKRRTWILIFSVVCALASSLVWFDYRYNFKGDRKVSSLKRLSPTGSFRNTLFLTYDDGPFFSEEFRGDGIVEDDGLRAAVETIVPGYDFRRTPTENILDLLAANDLTAIFFVVGDALEKTTNREEYLRRIAAGGHLVGGHSFFHEALLGQPAKKQVEDYQRSHDLILELTGIPPAAWRPPYGSWDDAMAEALRNGTPFGPEGFPALWTDTFYDWHPFDDPALADQVREEVETFLEKKKGESGRVVLLHDPWIRAVLYTAELVRQAPAHGFSFGRGDILVRAWRENQRAYLETPFRFYLATRLGQLGEESVIPLLGDGSDAGDYR